MKPLFEESSRTKESPGTREMGKLMLAVSQQMAPLRIFSGCSSTGHEAFLERHDQIFKTVHRGSTKHEDVGLFFDRCLQSRKLGKT